ncbi:MAG: helix-turn-helix transcriptional regulator [Sphingomonas sp.]
MFGERIRMLREARAWTQEHLAEAAGVSLRTVQRLEAGAGFASETALAVAAALDVDVRELLEPGEAGPNPLWPNVPMALKLAVPAMLVLPAILFLVTTLLRHIAGVPLPELPMLESPILLLGGPLVALLLPLATMIHPGRNWAGGRIAAGALAIRPRTAPFLVAIGALALLVCVFAYFAGHAVGHLARVVGL